MIIMELKALSGEQFDRFVKKHSFKSHFLQSFAWGELSKEKRQLFPYYLGLVDDEGEILAATLLLKKKLPLGLCYLYAPRGYVLDFHNSQLLEQFTKEVVKFAKRKKAIYIKIDPDIVWQRQLFDGTVIEEEKKEQKIWNQLLALGYHHLGFTKNFETSQPRYTFRIDLTQSLEEIESHFSKTTKQRIAKSLKLQTNVRIGTSNDLETFYHLMMLTENRKDFISHELDYYQTLYHLFNEQDKATLFLGSVNINTTVQVLTKDLETVTTQLETLPQENLSKSAKNKLKELVRQQQKLQEEIQKYLQYQQRYGQEIILSAHMIVEYGDKAWVLYAGNHNILTETYVNYATYYEHLKYCKERGLRIYDQFGTIGDLQKENPRWGLHEFKRKFGGDYIEFIGEFDYIIHPFYYFAFTKLVPIYRNIIKKRKKKELKNEVNQIK